MQANVASTVLTFTTPVQVKEYHKIGKALLKQNNALFMSHVQLYKKSIFNAFCVGSEEINNERNKFDVGSS